MGIVTEKVLGKQETLSMKIRMAFAYRRTIKYLLQTRGIYAVSNFLYAKTLVKSGEGAGGAFYFILDPLFRRFPQLAPYPRNIEVEVTTVCNRKCIICEHTYWKEKSQHLTFHDFRKIVDQFPDLKWCNLTGEGSAFLNPNYLKMLCYQKSRDISTFLVDHFEDIDEEIGEQLIKIGIDGIYVSMDGATKETYEKIKTGCNFDKVISNLKQFIKIKEEMNSPIPELCFRFVVTTLNVHEMPQYIDLIASLGSKEQLGDGTHAEFVGLLCFKEVEHLFVPEIPNYIIRNTLKKVKELNVDTTFFHTSRAEQLPNLECCTAWLEPYIAMGGYILPCCAVLMSNKRGFLRKYCFGNILETPFKDIWYSDRYVKFRKMVVDPKGKVPILCNGCRAYNTFPRIQKYGVATNV